jgi:hypothetical protein
MLVVVLPMARFFCEKVRSGAIVGPIRLPIMSENYEKSVAGRYTFDRPLTSGASPQER